MNNVLLAFVMSLFAGLSTGIGSGIALVSKHTDRKFMSLTLGFSAGVMLFVSMTEIMNKAKASLVLAHGLRGGNIICTLAFFGGMVLIALISRLIPTFEGEMAGRLFTGEGDSKKGARVNTGLLCALAIAIHNFPEGMATFVSALEDPALALPIVCAIAIHNIPEGIAVAAPVYKATGSRKKAFRISFLSGLAEPLGALVGWLLLLPFMSDTLFGIIFASSAGIMVYICIDEILPEAEEGGSHSLAVTGAVLGMALMALSLIMFL